MRGGRNRGLSRYPGRELAAASFYGWAAFLVGCGGSTAEPTIPPEINNPPPEPTLAQICAAPSTDDDWPVSNLCDTGLNAEPIRAMMSSANSHRLIGVDSVVIVHYGTVLFETYSSSYGPTARHDLRSATKSITSALIGIAVDRGLVPGVDAPIYPYFDDLAPHENWSARKDQITIENLLTMSPGLDCNDSRASSAGNESWMYRESDWVSFVLDLPVAGTPGEGFSYCTGGVVVLGELLRSASGLRADDFAREHLFSPLGITNYNWEFTPAGQVDTGGHIHMTARDMARIGQLFLDRGVWRGHRVVSESWVDASTLQRQDLWEDVGYGYLWWTRPMTDGNRTHEVFYADGNGGQQIFVVPDLELVVTFTGSNYNSPRQEIVFELMEMFVLSVFDS